MEESAKERERELRDDHEAKAKAQKVKYQGELARIHEMVRQRESEID
jgi:hypothetical protein